MSSKPVGAAVRARDIDSVIKVFRGLRVILDADLARFYGVTTAAINQAVRRNEDRFPDDFAFLLTQQEFSNLISQSVISSSGHGGRRKPPLVFTEHGVAMLAIVLRSPQAVRVNFEIRVRRGSPDPAEAPTAGLPFRDKPGRGDLRSGPWLGQETGHIGVFVRLRRLMATPGELAERIMKPAETVQLHDERIKAIASVVRELMEKPSEPQGRIGFQAPTPRD
jgi:hypothetical protein